MFKESGNNIKEKDYQDKAKAIKSTYDDLTDKVPGLYDHSERMRTYFKGKKTLTNGGSGGIIEKRKEQVGVGSVQYVGKIDKNIYKCVTSDILTDEVIITDERIEHIKERHPNDYERFCQYMKEAITAPTYIIESKKPNTALVLKEIIDGEKRFKIVLRIITSTDNKEYKNSIITFMKIDEKEWKRMVKNKKVLYKSE